jgi:hypothetical protein
MILGLSRSADWLELRRTYQKLIKQWHPDRFHGNSVERRLAEEKTKEITKAYKLLAGYYKQHGNLPPADDVSSDASSAFTPATTSHSPSTDDVPADQRNYSLDPDSNVRSTYVDRPNRTWRSVAAVLAAGLLGYLWLLDKPGDLVPEQAPPNTNSGNLIAPAKPTEAKDQHFITLGSRFGEVHSIQGNPSSVEGDIWHYGKSQIRFTKGKVSGWENHPDNPLKIFRDDGSTLPADSGFFARGATKSEVRAVQGTPWQESDNEWTYGASRIYFVDGLVTGWHESPYHPLKLKK